MYLYILMKKKITVTLLNLELKLCNNHQTNKVELQ